MYYKDVHYNCCEIICENSKEKQIKMQIAMYKG